MKVRRYFATNMRSALDLVKQEQGAEVLILSNRQVDGGVELVTADELTEQEAAQLATNHAAVRRELAEPHPAKAAAEDADRQTAMPRSQTSGPAEEQFLWTERSAVTKMHEELSSLKGLLETQLSGLAWNDFANRHPLRARVMRSLARLGVSPRLARELVATLSDELDFKQAWHFVLANLLLRLGNSERDALETGGTVALFGPTGVGKTTLAMKIAARFALARGPETVAVISLDDQRLGAHEQLKAFGRLVRVPVYPAREAGQLAELLEMNQRRDLVLIDTPGMSPASSEYRAQVERIRALERNAAIYHVASAPTDYSAALHMLGAAVEQGADACVLSKVDEARTLGPALSALAETACPLAYTTDGQRIPDDLERFDARALIARGVELARSLDPVTDSVIFETAFA